MADFHENIKITVDKGALLAACSLEELQWIKENVHRYIDYAEKHPPEPELPQHERSDDWWDEEEW